PSRVQPGARLGSNVPNGDPMQTHPILKRNANVTQPTSDNLSIAYLDEEVPLPGPAAQLFGKMLPYLDGANDIGKIAERIGESPGRVQTTAGELAEAAAL